MCRVRLSQCDVEVAHSQCLHKHLMSKFISNMKWSSRRQTAAKTLALVFGACRRSTATARGSKLIMEDCWVCRELYIIMDWKSINIVVRSSTFQKPPISEAHKK